jgi:hypothetical protein
MKLSVVGVNAMVSGTQLSTAQQGLAGMPTVLTSLQIADSWSAGPVFVPRGNDIGRDQTAEFSCYARAFDRGIAVRENDHGIP